MFNSIKFLLTILLVLPFPAISNSLFQKIDLKLNKNLILNDKNNIEKNLINILDFNSNYVVNFWATWCIPCKKELPDLNKMKIENEVLQISVQEQLREAYIASDEDLEYVQEEFSAFCKNQQLKKALLSSVDLLIEL